jgi:hypothetical protein
MYHKVQCIKNTYEIFVNHKNTFFIGTELSIEENIVHLAICERK